MRFMVIVKATKDSEAGEMPSQELLTAMGKYNEELVKAGIMLAGDGLQPARGRPGPVHGTKRTVVDGPFAETKELVAGFWIWQVRRWTRPSNGSSAAPTRCRGHPRSRSARSSRRRFRRIVTPEVRSSERLRAESEKLEPKSRAE